MASAAFHTASRRHTSVLEWLDQNRGQDAAARAASVWDAIVSVDRSPVTDSAAECAADTRPEELRALLVENEPAASVAWTMLQPVYMTTGVTPRALRDVAREAWQKFSEHAGAVEDLAVGFGWDLSQSWQVWRDVAQSAGSTADVTRIAQLAGRFVVALKGAMAKRIAGAIGDIYSVEQGATLARILPSERMAMGDEVLEAVFLEKFQTRRLLQYSVRGRSPAGRGPIVIAVDESGSMIHDKDYKPDPRRNTFAKAACLAIAQVAKSERRSISVVHFAEGCVEHTLDPKSPDQVMRTLRSFLSGGTNIGLALERALVQVKDLAKKGDTGADVILVTDGVDGNEERIAAAVGALAAFGARLWTVAIECAIAEQHPLRARAATYVELGVRDLTDPASMLALKGAI